MPKTKRLHLEKAYKDRRLINGRLWASVLAEASALSATRSSAHRQPSPAQIWEASATKRKAPVVLRYPLEQDPHCTPRGFLAVYPRLAMYRFPVFSPSLRA